MNLLLLLLLGAIWGSSYLFINVNLDVKVHVHIQADGGIERSLNMMPQCFVAR